MDELQEVWVGIGQNIARGSHLLNKSDLLAIAYNLDVTHFRTDFLPGSLLIQGSPADRRQEAFRLADEYWRISPYEWLKKENSWLESVRQFTNSSVTGGKDKLEDVVSAQILVRFVAAANTVTKYPAIADETVLALSLFVQEVVAKGRTRLQVADQEKKQTTYKILKDNGVSIGSVGAKYLPNPEVSLPELLVMLDRDHLSKHVY